MPWGLAGIQHVSIAGGYVGGSLTRAYILLRPARPSLICIYIACRQASKLDSLSFSILTHQPTRSNPHILFHSRYIYSTTCGMAASPPPLPLDCLQSTFPAQSSSTTPPIDIHTTLLTIHLVLKLLQLHKYTQISHINRVNPPQCLSSKSATLSRTTCPSPTFPLLPRARTLPAAASPSSTTPARVRLYIPVDSLSIMPANHVSDFNQNRGQEQKGRHRGRARRLHAHLPGQPPARLHPEH